MYNKYTFYFKCMYLYNIANSDLFSQVYLYLKKKFYNMYFNTWNLVKLDFFKLYNID